MHRDSNAELATPETAVAHRVSVPFMCDLTRAAAAIHGTVSRTAQAGCSADYSIVSTTISATSLTFTFSVTFSSRRPSSNMVMQ